VEIKDIRASGFGFLAPMKDAADSRSTCLWPFAPAAGRVGNGHHPQDAAPLDSGRDRVQLIANTIASAELTEQRKARDTDYAVNGQHSSFAGRQFHGIYLAHLEAKRGAGAIADRASVEFHASRLRCAPACRHARSAMGGCSSSTRTGLDGDRPGAPNPTPRVPARPADRRPMAVDRQRSPCAPLERSAQSQHVRARAGPT
jgi:hypothetical protein